MLEQVADGRIKYRRFGIKECTKIPRLSFKNEHLVVLQRAILGYDELFASSLATAQPNRAPQVLVETLLVVVSEKSFRFRKVLFEK